MLKDPDINELVLDGSGLMGQSYNIHVRRMFGRDCFRIRFSLFTKDKKKYYAIQREFNNFANYNNAALLFSTDFLDELSVVLSEFAKERCFSCHKKKRV
jgi:hypothetical protein